ncbi:hypothetical protein FRB94_007558 [Tulasnella sp. JGI-2019a]|nr:hypothetical protein FRB94_007558 [Tulasnella sp. JGI-2019a]KAG9028365.1 hypothetical protein FRB95_006547 [Tulasnella sp. JGI-2019a]
MPDYSPICYKELAGMFQRIFWFGLGGTTAYLLHKHNTDEEGRERWQKNCMKHSWGRRCEEWQREREREADVATNEFSAGVPYQGRARRWGEKRDVEQDVSQASEKLISTVKSGVQSVLGMLTEMETAVNRQKELRAQLNIPQAGPSVSPTAAFPEVTPVPVVPLETGSIRSVPPTYTSGATAPPAPIDPSIQHILTAIEKLNARIDALSPPPPSEANAPPKRLV